MDEQIRERVERGAKFLDEQMPEWIDEIDLNTLALRSPCRCVLGQLFGDYSEGVDALDLDFPDEEDRGFHIAFDETRSRWEELTEAWKSLILARRQAASDGP
jgi:hypothetical protein